jgi:hypothetical protein
MLGVFGKNKPVLEFHKGDDILIPITTITQIMI